MNTRFALTLASIWGFHLFVWAPFHSCVIIWLFPTVLLGMLLVLSSSYKDNKYLKHESKLNLNSHHQFACFYLRGQGGAVQIWKSRAFRICPPSELLRYGSPPPPLILRTEIFIGIFSVLQESLQISLHWNGAPSPRLKACTGILPPPFPCTQIFAPPLICTAHNPPPPTVNNDLSLT